MGWIFRRAINIGPFRINLSKSGIGGSVGAGPFRMGRSASGRRYTSTRIPGTGLSYRTTSSARGAGRSKGSCMPGCGCIPMAVIGIAAFGLIAWWISSSAAPPR